MLSHYQHVIEQVMETKRSSTAVIKQHYSFNDHFNVFLSEENLSKIIRPPKGAIYHQYLQEIKKSFLWLLPKRGFNVIMSIKSSHTAAVDGLCSKMIKAVANEIVDLLVYSLVYESFSALWGGIRYKMINNEKNIPDYIP